MSGSTIGWIALTAAGIALIVFEILSEGHRQTIIGTILLVIGAAGIIILGITTLSAGGNAIPGGFIISGIGLGFSMVVISRLISLRKVKSGDIGKEMERG